MVGVGLPANEKLRKRVRSIVVRGHRRFSGDEVDAALDAAGGETKVAIMALLAGVDPAVARVRLDATGGNLREALVREARRLRGARRRPPRCGRAQGGRWPHRRRTGWPAANGTAIAVPGFVDLQVNGFAGVDFLEGLLGLAVTAEPREVLLETGVTSFLPTFITAPEEALPRGAFAGASCRLDGAAHPRRAPGGTVPC